MSKAKSLFTLSSLWPLAVSAAFPVIAACGGGSSPANTPSGTGEPAPAASTAPASSGASDSGGGSKSAMAEVMMTKVVPQVGKVFKEHNAKEHEKFGCVTCHGPQRQDPHQFLPKLTMSNGGFEKLAKEHPEDVKFMSEKVVPAMAAALGQKPYDPATKQGFGCGGCHAID